LHKDLHAYIIGFWTKGGPVYGGNNMVGEFTVVFKILWC
jgi:hypothetical protein